MHWKYSQIIVVPSCRLSINLSLRIASLSGLQLYGNAGGTGALRNERQLKEGTTSQIDHGVEDGPSWDTYPESICDGVGAS